ncbi:MAG TPA: ABC transporter permease subunit, partial [Thermoanaerobaculia bacterium]|nr:ABC transporter permease subunit [Thermoanaerobaculia bacterium]
MKVLIANIEDVLREAAARWTLIAYFFLSTIFILIFASAVNLDIVNGTLAGARLFGKDVQMSGSEIPIEKLVLGFETGFSAVLYVLCTFLAIFATAHLVPRMQEKGTIDLYLARPVGRVRLLLSRYVAGLVLAASNIIYLIGVIWLIVVWKTHVAYPRFLLGGAIILFLIAALLAFAFLIGVITSSTAVSIMGTTGVFFFGLMLVGHERIAAAVSKEWEADLINGLYWIIPKTAELGGAVVAFVSGGKTLPDQVAQTLTPMP